MSVADASDQPIVMTPPYSPASETLADFAWRVIDDVFTQGSEEQIQECVRAFYQRVDCKDGVRVVEMHGGPYDGGVVLEKDGEFFRIESEDWKYRCNGRPIKDAKLADMLGVPVAFLDGLTVAYGLFAENLQTRHMQEKEKQSLEAERKRLKSVQRSLDKKLAIGNAGTLARETVVKSLRRAAEKSLKRKQLNCGIASAERKFWNEITARCSSHDMPPVPPPMMRRSKIRELPPFSGLYFEWDGLLCTYVGKSVNVPARLSDGHHKLQGDSEMSFIEMDVRTIGRNELFYIWLLNPAKNGGLD